MSDNLKPCNVCGTKNSSLHFCDVCGLQCCQQCLGQHKSNKICSLIKEQLSPSSGFCDSHQSAYTKFCLKCCILLCPKCENHHSEHNVDTCSIIDAVKKLRRDIPKCVDRLSAIVINANSFVTSFTDKHSDLRSLQTRIDIEEKVWHTQIIEGAKGLCRQIEQLMTELDIECNIQQQRARDVKETIATLNSVEKVKYSLTFALLWVYVKKELDQLEIDVKKKSLSQRVSFQSGIEDHSKLCHMFGCLQK